MKKNILRKFFFAIAAMGSFLIADYQSGKCNEAKVVWNCKEPVWQYALANDTSLISIKGLDNRIQILDTTNGKELYTFIIPEDVKSMALDAATRIFASAHHSAWEKDRSKPSIINIWSILSGELLKKIEVPLSTQEMPDKTAKSHDLPTSRPVSHVVQKIGFSPKGNYLVATIDNGIFIWQMPSGKLFKFLRVSYPTSFSFSPDENTIAVGTSNSLGLDSSGSSVFLFRVLDGELLFSPPQPSETGSITSIQFDGDGHFFASVNQKSIINLWYVSKGYQQATIDPKFKNIESASFSLNKESLAIGSSLIKTNDIPKIQVWDIIQKIKLFDVTNVQNDISQLFYLNNERLGYVSKSHRLAVIKFN